MLGGWNAATYGFNTVLIQSCQASNNLDCGGSTYGYGTPAHQQHCRERLPVQQQPRRSRPGEQYGQRICDGETEDGLIDHCVAHDNGGAGTNSAGRPAYGATTPRDYHPILRIISQQAQHQDGDGYDLDIGTHNSVIQYCYAHDNFGAGYLLCTDGSTTQWSNNIVRYCISEHDGTGGHLGALHFYCPGGSAPLEDSQIYNNTIYSSVAPAVEFDSFGSMAGLALRNNVFITTTNTLISASASPTTAQALFQGNDYWTIGGIFKIQNGANTYYNRLSAWSAATSQEKIGSTNVGVNVDPQLNKPGGGGTVGDAYALTSLAAYQLQPTSPMINAGLNLPALFGLNPGPRIFSTHRFLKWAATILAPPSSKRADNHGWHDAARWLVPVDLHLFPRAALQGARDQRAYRAAHKLANLDEWHFGSVARLHSPTRTSRRQTTSDTTSSFRPKPGEAGVA